MTYKLLDAREMAHPEPLERAVDILRQLDNESCLYMLIKKNPVPLLQIARENRLNHISEEITVGEWHVIITPNQDIDLRGQLHV